LVIAPEPVHDERSTDRQGEPVGTRPHPGSPLVAGGRANAIWVDLFFWVGAALVAWSGAVHFRLWSTGYRHIATIGPLFMFQGVAAVVLAVVVAAFRRVWAALAAFVFVAATIGGFLISVEAGLFGFQDTWTAPFAVMAFGVEVAACVVLAAAAGLAVQRSRPRRS